MAETKHIILAADVSLDFMTRTRRRALHKTIGCTNQYPLWGYPARGLLIAACKFHGGRLLVYVLPSNRSKSKFWIDGRSIDGPHIYGTTNLDRLIQRFYLKRVPIKA